MKMPLRNFIEAEQEDKTLCEPGKTKRKEYL